MSETLKINPAVLPRLKTDVPSRSRAYSSTGPRRPSLAPMSALSGSGANLLSMPTSAIPKKAARRVSTFFVPISGDEEGDSKADLAIGRKSKSNLINLAGSTATGLDKRLSSIRRPTVKPLGRGMTLMEKENGELEIKINIKSPLQTEPSVLTEEYIPETIPLSGMDDVPASPIGSSHLSNSNSLARLMTTSRNSLHRLNTTKTISTSSMNKQAVDDGNVFIKALQSLDKREEETTPVEAPPADYLPNLEAPHTSRPNLFQPQQVDSSSIFPTAIATVEGVFIFRIENLIPILMGLESYGQFCTVDAYIILVSTMGDKELEHSVYTWIGATAQTDKKFCCAMYAVSLRNMVQSPKRISRMVEGEESEEFLKVFEGSVTVLDSRFGTETGLFMVQERAYPIKMYRVDGKSKPLLVMVCKSVEILDPRHVYLLDTGKEMYQWNGSMSTLQNKSKARIVASRINKHERNGKCEYIEVDEGEESQQFLDKLDQTPDEATPRALEQTLDLYRVFPKIAPELEDHVLASGAKLKKSMLVSDGVFILDAGTEISVWIGKDAWQEIRSLSNQLLSMVIQSKHRPSYLNLNKYHEGSEPEIFKMLFSDWQEVSTPTSAALGSPVRSPVRQRLKIEADTLLHPPLQVHYDKFEVMNTMQACNEFLEAFTSFVFQKGKFVKLPDNERGHFFEKEAYVFLCIYNCTNDQLEKLETCTATANHLPKFFAEDDESLHSQDDYPTLSCVVYFCQSKKTPKAPYSNFQLSTLKEMQELVRSMYKCSVRVQLVEYGMEPFALLAHLENNYVFHSCTRAEFAKRSQEPSFSKNPQLYQIRVDSRYFTTRAVQIDASQPFISKDCVFVYEAGSPKNVLWKGPQFPVNDLDSVVLSLNHIIASLEPTSDGFEEDFAVDEVSESQDNRSHHTKSLSGSSDYKGLEVETSVPDDQLVVPSNVHIATSLDDPSLIEILSFQPRCINIPYEHPRAYVCTSAQGFLEISLINSLTQPSLKSDCCVFVDSGPDYELFLWIGKECSASVSSLAKECLVYWIKKCDDGRFNQAERPAPILDFDPDMKPLDLDQFLNPCSKLVTLQQDMETESFKAYFQIWNEIKIIDPGNNFSRVHGAGWKMDSPVAKPLIS